MRFPFIGIDSACRCWLAGGHSCFRRSNIITPLSPAPTSTRSPPKAEIEPAENLIVTIRRQRVILSADLARICGVPTKALNQAIRRNAERFPPDFVLRISRAEADRIGRLRSQSVTLKRGQHLKYRPFVFTEHGILMLSSVLNSERAIQVNIEIMRAFVRLRKLVAGHRELTAKLTELERRVASHDEHIEAIFNAIRQLMTPPPARVKQIGFRPKALEK